MTHAYKPPSGVEVNQAVRATETCQNPQAVYVRKAPDRHHQDGNQRRGLVGVVKPPFHPPKNLEIDVVHLALASWYIQHVKYARGLITHLGDELTALLARINRQPIGAKHAETGCIALPLRLAHLCSIKLLGRTQALWVFHSTDFPRSVYELYCHQQERVLTSRNGQGSDKERTYKLRRSHRSHTRG